MQNNNFLGLKEFETCPENEECTQCGFANDVGGDAAIMKYIGIVNDTEHVILEHFEEVISFDNV